MQATARDSFTASFLACADIFVFTLYACGHTPRRFIRLINRMASRVLWQRHAWSIFNRQLPHFLLQLRSCHAPQCTNTLTNATENFGCKCEFRASGEQRTLSDQIISRNLEARLFGLRLFVPE